VITKSAIESLPRTLNSRGASLETPRGRPRKSLDFDHELIRESKSFITINENGRKRRISKHDVVVKQLMKQAMTGGAQAFRIYFGLRQQALERLASLVPQQSIESLKYEDPKNLTDEQLMMIIAADLEQKKQESGKGHLSNAEFIESRALPLLSSSTRLLSSMADPTMTRSSIVTGGEVM
jgi:hypothetical protein